MSRSQLVQTAYIVDDLTTAVTDWRETSGIGPFFIMSNVRPQNGYYRGLPVELEMDIAFVQAGPMQIELIQVLSSVPSVYGEGYAPSHRRFHHLCYFAVSLQEEQRRFESIGVPVAYIANFGELKFAYFDTRARTGGFTEVLEIEPGVQQLFQTISDAAVDWDGKDPIRHIG